MQLISLVADSALSDQDHVTAAECALELIEARQVTSWPLSLKLALSEDLKDLTSRLKFAAFALQHAPGPSLDHSLTPWSHLLLDAHTSELLSVDRRLRGRLALSSLGLDLPPSSSPETEMTSQLQVLTDLATADFLRAQAKSLSGPEMAEVRAHAFYEQLGAPMGDRSDHLSIEDRQGLLLTYLYFSFYSHLEPAPPPSSLLDVSSSLLLHMGADQLRVPPEFNSLLDELVALRLPSDTSFALALISDLLPVPLTSSIPT